MFNTYQYKGQEESVEIGISDNGIGIGRKTCPYLIGL